MPAGLELENQNLNNTLKLTDIRIDGETVQPTASIVHQEYRNDRYVAAVDLHGEQSYTVYVLSRAVNPGQYVLPAVRIESMYRPAIHGVGGSLKSVTIGAAD